jgi:hypothetical protein
MKTSLNLIFGLALGLSACATAGDNDWPTVSFGHDIAATNAAIEQTPEVALAPLPTLTSEDTAGLENPTSYLNAIGQDYRDLASNLEARFQDYSRARQSLSQSGDDMRAQNWLTAQMELSNISQYTEDLTKLRARMAALDPLPESGRVLLARMEAQELQNRLFVREEKTELQALEPGS